MPDISCGHCEGTITKALSGQPGVSSVKVDIAAKQVALEYEQGKLSLDRVKEILAEEDYPVGAVVDDDPGRHLHEAPHRIDGLTVRIGDRRGQSEESAIDEARSVQVEGLRHPSLRRSASAEAS